MDRSRMLAEQDCTIQLAVYTPDGRKWGLQATHRFNHPDMAKMMSSMMMDAITRRLTQQGYDFIFDSMKSGVVAEEVFPDDFPEKEEN